MVIIIKGMKLESVGILVKLTPYGERDSIARIFTRDYGVMCGMVKGAQVARKNRALVGQVGNVSWNARLDSHLGTFHWEAEKNLSVDLFNSYDSLKFMNSALSLIDALLSEREKYENLYLKTLELFQNLSTRKIAPEKTYLNWEIFLLKELGYALNLSRCSGCGGRRNLDYISSRTGRAVCEKCAAPYMNKVFKLPLTLDITRHFLENICFSQGTQLPQARRMLLQNNF